MRLRYSSPARLTDALDRAISGQQTMARVGFRFAARLGVGGSGSRRDAVAFVTLDLWAFRGHRGESFDRLAEREQGFVAVGLIRQRRALMPHERLCVPLRNADSRKVRTKRDP